MSRSLCASAIGCRLPTGRQPQAVSCRLLAISPRRAQAGYRPRILGRRCISKMLQRPLALSVQIDRADIERLLDRPERFAVRVRARLVALVAVRVE